MRHIAPGQFLPLAGLTLAEATRYARHMAIQGPVADTVSILMLRNIALEPIEPFLSCHCLNVGLQARIRFGGYNTLLQDATAPETLDDPPQLIVLALALEELEPDHAASPWTPQALADRILEPVERIRTRLPVPVMLHTLPRPLYPDHGAQDNWSPESVTFRIQEVNRLLREYAGRHGLPLCDWERLFMRLGADNCWDPRTRYLYRAPCKPLFLDAFAEEIARVAMALKGRSRKVLVLDCDNTLWGGVVGEEGVAGIKLDAHTFPGRAFRDFQNRILRLHQRGVLLLLCSKNNPEDVWEVFDRHPAMVLQRRHLAGFRINWEEKPANLVAMARELNLGLDAFVFVDDNPMECGLMQNALPMVVVRQVPPEPHLMEAFMAREVAFDTLQTTREDRERTALYAAEALRDQERLTMADTAAYLASLQTVAALHAAREEELPRVAQLTQKTNQFNLTTRRRSLEEVQHWSRDPGRRVFTLTARDRHGDLGLTGVLMACREGAGCRIDTLLMSCRVLKRGLEQQFVVWCLGRLLEEWRPEWFLADYLPTAKNGQVAEFWESFGFAATVREGGAKSYRALPEQLRLVEVPHVAVETSDGPGQ